MIWTSLTARPAVRLGYVLARLDICFSVMKRSETKLSVVKWSAKSAKGRGVGRLAITIRIAEIGFRCRIPNYPIETHVF